MHHVVPCQRRNGNVGNVLDSQFAGKGAVVVHDRLKNSGLVVHQIHLVHGHQNMRDLEEGGQEAMPFGLGQDSLARIDEDDSQLGR